MDRSHLTAVLPQASFCRKHRAADEPPVMDVSMLHWEASDSPEAKETMMELCRALDRLLWKRATTPTREERGNE